MERPGYHQYFIRWDYMLGDSVALDSGFDARSCEELKRCKNRARMDKIYGAVKK